MSRHEPDDEPNRISDEEMERIAQFVETPRYRRTPELLEPDRDEDEDERERDQSE